MKKQLASIVLATALVFPGVASAAETTTPVTDQTQTEVQVSQSTDPSTTVEAPAVQTEGTTEVQADVTTEPTETTDTQTEQPAVTDETTTAPAENTTEEVVAPETTVDVEAGLTPEDSTYFLDTLLENVELTFTFDPEVKAQVYAEISAERLAELKALNPETQSEFVKDLLASYEEALAKSGEQVEEAKAEGTEIAQETTDAIDQVATEGEEAVVEVADDLEDEQKEALEETITTTKVTAAVVRNIDPEVVQSLRDQGVGYGKIALTVSISNLSGKSVEEITELLKKSGIGKVAKDLGLHPGKLKDAKMTITIETETETTDATSESTSEETVAEVTVDSTATQSTTTGTEEIATQTLNITDAAKAPVKNKVKPQVSEKTKVKIEKDDDDQYEKREEISKKAKEIAKEKKEKAEEKAKENREKAKENKEKEKENKGKKDRDNEREDD